MAPPIDWDCYVLVLELTCNTEVATSHGFIALKPGVYFYVGSSRRPGGAIARLARHLSRNKKVWWHIDRLTSSGCCNTKGVYLLSSECTDCEVEVARSMAKWFDYAPTFGSTDKPQSPSHLFKCEKELYQCLYDVYDLLEGLECVRDVVYVDLETHP